MDDFMDMNLTGLDLNRDPTSDRPLHMETSRAVIEGRMRQLEAVTARSRQRQRLRQVRNAVQATYSHGDGVNLRDRGKGCKRDSSHLVAKALEMDSEAAKPDEEEGGGGSFYDCSVCLELAKDPVLTCCGHMFCWSCFYQVPKVDLSSKECPVCKGEVLDSSLTPIYGIGDSEGIRVTESGLQIPPRPRASRVEGARQQQQVTTQQSLLSAQPTPMYGNGGDSTESGLQIPPRPRPHGPVAEMIRWRIRNRISAMNGDHHRVRTHQVSRVLSESDTSLSSFMSDLSIAERLVDELESELGNETRAPPVDIESDLPRPLSGIRSGDETVGPMAPTSSSIVTRSSFVWGNFIRSGDETVGPTSSSIVRRRSIVWGGFDLDNHHPHGPIRRRLT